VDRDLREGPLAAVQPTRLGVGAEGGRQEPDRQASNGATGDSGVSEAAPAYCPDCCREMVAHEDHYGREWDWCDACRKLRPVTVRKARRR
jgi:hypothetical protein